MLYPPAHIYDFLSKGFYIGITVCCYICCDSFCIYKYDPGDYLKRHRDSAGGYWKFKLIFLRADAPHFCWYDEEGNSNLVDETPGMFIDMPVNLEHEVTKIEQNERPKISLALSWGRTR